MAIMWPQLSARDEYGVSAPVLVWRFDQPLRAIASAVTGGGIGDRQWVVNASVPIFYDRPDPGAHLAEIAGGLGLAGPGVGLLTGVDVAGFHAASDGGVRAVATVGLGTPAWAAAPDGHLVRWRPGTVNIVVSVPAPLAPAALVNAVATVAEAKAQALWDLGLPGTGTASDATCVLCPAHGPAEPYGGPRSRWGARLARAVHAAVLAGGRAWLAGGGAWSDRIGLVAPGDGGPDHGGPGAGGPGGAGGDRVERPGRHQRLTSGPTPSEGEPPSAIVPGGHRTGEEFPTFGA
jgi:adenosylcobinamide hydrolase